MTELERRYRFRLAELRSQIVATLQQLYGSTVTLDDLDAGFAALIPQAAVVVQAGQSRAVSLATAYLSALVTLNSGRLADLGSLTAADLIGFTQEGVPLAEGMAAWPSMVKQQIGKGATSSQASKFGRFLVERFADAEVTRAADSHSDAVTKQSGEFSGWEGIVSPKACAPCSANSGFHDLSEPMYRHGSCNCTKQYVVAP